MRLLGVLFIQICFLLGCVQGKDSRHFIGAEKSDVVYGTNSIRTIQLEKYNQRPEIQNNILASVALVDNGNLVNQRDHFQLLTETAREKYQLCKGSLFAQEQTISFCSGVLVRPNLVLTAAHCLNNGINQCENTRFIFNLHQDKFNKQQIEKNDVFDCKKVIYIGKENNGVKEDFALVQLDRVAQAKPAKITRDLIYSNKQKVYLVIRVDQYLIKNPIS